MQGNIYIHSLIGHSSHVEIADFYDLGAFMGLPIFHV